MPRLESRWSGAEADPGLFEPRDDLVLEAEVGAGSVRPGGGPVPRPTSARSQAVADGADHRGHHATGWPSRGSAGSSRSPPAAASPGRLLDRLHGGRQPWWAPPQRLDARAAHVLGLLAAAELIAGFCNTLFSQTAAFAADEFGASEGAQGVAGSVVRLGIVFTVILLALADRVGRRRILVGTAIAAPLLAAVGALAPVAGRAHRHCRRSPGRSPSPSVSWSRSWPPRRCRRAAGPTR